MLTLTRCLTGHFTVTGCVQLCNRAYAEDELYDFYDFFLCDICKGTVYPEMFGDAFDND